MPVDPSMGKWLHLAVQTSEQAFRACLTHEAEKSLDRVLGAQKWLDGIHDDPDTLYPDAFNVIQMTIGQELRIRLDPPGELPHGLLTLLIQLND